MGVGPHVYIPYGDMFITDDGGKTWVHGSNAENFLISCFFINDHVGYRIIEGIPRKIEKSSDSGINWHNVYKSNADSSRDFLLLRNLSFISEQSGWAVGNDTSLTDEWQNRGMILETEDGGNNWKTQVKGLSAPLNAIHFKDGYGWAVGGNGLVLRTDDGTNWIDDTTGKTYPNKFNLSQNYPNPFNPSTTIKFDLPKTETVKIEVYNTIGQKIETLLNKAMKAGHHEIEFNAQYLSSGIYFNRIKAGDFQDEKKIILIK